MAFTHAQIDEIKGAMASFLARRRPPPERRDKVDIQYSIRGQSVEILEIRPHWRLPAKQIKAPIAKTTFVRTQNTWKIYWMRADLKWHGYTPQLEAATFKVFLDVVDTDDYACFFG